MNLMFFVAIIIFCSVTFVINGYLHNRDLDDKVTRIILLLFAVCSIISLTCNYILPPGYVFIDRAQPFGFIFGPLMYYLIIPSTLDVPKARIIFYHRIPFYFAVPIYIMFILSSNLRDLWGGDFYVIWYSCMLLLWSIYLIMILFNIFKNRSLMKLTFFSFLWLTLFVVLILFLGYFLVESNFKSTSFSTSTLLIICVFLLSVFLYFNTLYGLKMFSVVKVEERYYFDSDVLNFINKGYKGLVFDELEHSLKPNSPPPSESFLLERISFLNGNTTIQEQAEQLGITVSELSKLIKDRTDLTYPQYINKCRIEFFIKTISEQPDAEYEEWIFKSGFNSKASFYRSFKKYTGKTPLEYFKKA